MFSYFKSSKRAASAPQAGANAAAEPGGEWSAEEGYDAVRFAGGATTPAARSSSRQSFSAPRATDAEFLGASYPPKYNDEVLRKGSAATNGYPALRQTFLKLEAFLADHSPSLLDSLLPPLLPTSPALLSLLDAIYPYRLPQAVLDSYAIHNGQDIFAFGTSNGGSGLFFGLDWMSIESVEAEYLIWRKFEKAGGMNGMEDHFSTTAFENDYARTGTGQPHPHAVEDEESQAAERGEDGRGGIGMDGMKSFPLGWVRRKYSHPGWLPLLTDRAGNYIGVDLDPPPPPSSSSPQSSTSKSVQTSFGQPGQVIAFGREVDEKVVLFPGDSAGGWGRFLAAFVEDLERGEFARLEDDNTGRGGSRRSPKGGASDEEEEWDRGDGLGDVGYLDGARYGDEGEGDENGAREAADGRIWSVCRSASFCDETNITDDRTLRSEYRRWMSDHDDEGGVIGAIAERSRRKWRLVGIGLPTSSPTSPALSITPTFFTAGRAKAAPLSVVVPPRETIEEGPFSSATERPDEQPLKSPNLMGSESPGVETVEDPLIEQGLQNVELESPTRIATRSASSSVSLVLSPPSPTQARFANPLEDTESNSSRKNSRENSRVPPSPDFLTDGRRSSRNPRPLGTPKAAPRRRPPPPICSIELPTFDDLDFSPDDEGRIRRRGGHDPDEVESAPPAVPERDFLATARRNIEARRGGKVSPSILPIANDHNSSSTALVDLGASSAGPITNGNGYRSGQDGLGISSPV